jgi:hypothetical protein
MLYTSSLPDTQWDKAYMCATFVKNHLPTAANNGLAPFTKFYNRPPTVAHFRSFGELGYVHQHPHQRQSKLSPKAKLMRFVGYSTTTKNFFFTKKKRRFFYLEMWWAVGFLRSP